MYGIVLMAAMAGGVEAPEFGRRGCSCSCSSCYSCSGCWSSCSSCWSCSSCSCKGTRVKRSRCHGCSSCHGCHGCYSSCHGCYSSCHGCHGGYAYCTGCYGSCHGGYAYCTGCYGGYTGCYGGCAAPAMTAPAEGGKVIEEKKIEQKKGENGEAAAAAPARIIVSLPAEAKLTVDGTSTVSTSDTRVLESPTLEPGKTFSYNLKAEFVRNGKSVVIAKKVQISAGSTVNVSLFDGAAVASR